MHDDSMKLTVLIKQVKILMRRSHCNLHAKKNPCSDLEIPVTTEKLRPRIEADSDWQDMQATHTSHRSNSYVTVII